MRILVAVCFLSTLLVCCNGDSISAIQGLVSRVLGEKFVKRFQYEVIDPEPGTLKDVFEVDSTMQDGNPVPVLRGNNGVALASALNYYLKYYCYCSVSWGDDGSGDQLQLPEPLPTGFPKVRQVMAKFRYYMNVCTVSYSMVWWDIDRWTREIDWMALNGINMPLSFTGQEYVWKKFYMSLGLNESEIDAYFSGPAFLAWQRMGNLKGWGGPLNDAWIDAQRDLQLQILNKTREFGMMNVLPGFAGHVPDAIRLQYPNSTFIKNSNWGRFNATYSGDVLLEPTDPLFMELGKKYYEILIAEYGTDHLFNSDTYNEMQPSSKDKSFLAATNKAIYDAMAAVDKEGIFVMQGWLFQETGFWTNDAIKAFLSGVSDDKMIILDLSAEARPIWERTESFFGKPYIYCLLHNFGGMRGIYGNLDVIGSGPITAATKKGSTFVGIGLTPEAIEQNPVVYDLMMEMSWRNETVDVEKWLQLYARRRYGNVSDPVIRANLGSAWSLLYQCCYVHDFSWDYKSRVERAPAISMGTTTNWESFPNATIMVKALEQLLTGHNDKNLIEVGPYQYDIVDITRQAITNLFADVQVMFGLSYQKWQLRNENSTKEFMSITNAMLEMISDLDKLLASNTNFLLGKWIEGARNSVQKESKEVQDLYEFNARNQITMWGYHENIEDYASKQWAGLVGDYYMRRWKLFSGLMLACLDNGSHLYFDTYENQRYTLEQEWGMERTKYPTKPKGQLMAIVYDIYLKYISVQGSQITYKETQDSEMNGEYIYLFGAGYKTWTKDVNQLRYLCDINPTCVGFTSTGVAYNATGTITKSPSVTLYTKLNTP